MMDAATFQGLATRLQTYGIGAAWFDNGHRLVMRNQTLSSVEGWSEDGTLRAALSPGSAVYWETSIEPFLAHAEEIKDVAISLETEDGPRYFLAFVQQCPEGLGIIFVPYEERYRFERQMREALREAGDREMQGRRLQEMESMHRAFIKTVAHELATPMTPILLELGILARIAGDGHDPALAKAVDRIQKNVSKLQHFQDSIVEAARLQESSAVVRPDLCSLDELARATVKAWQEEHPDATVHLETQVTEAIADEDAIRNCLRHVLDNAHRFSPPAGRITVLVQGDGHAEIRVTDEGRGIEPHMLRHLAQPFAKSHTENEFTQLGAGLGLFIVRGLLELQGGSLELKSPGLGKGTTATLRLPLVAKASSKVDAGRVS